MSEIVGDRKVFSLSEVTGSIKRTLTHRYTSTFWVQAEMNKLNFYKHSGHCYPELLEKKDNKVVAQMRGTMWNSDYQRINEAFLRTVKEPLKDGIRILFEASLMFEPVHGLSLRIHSMEPAFTLGDLEIEKQKSIEQLQREGLFQMNQSRKLSVLPLRIAVISVETSKGYADFTQTLYRHPARYAFRHRLFTALLQGERAVPSIIDRLKEIAGMQEQFDVVAIIRGGGGEVGLSCYNHYELARAVAMFPLPVLTGIGHATNFTVTEMVSYKNAITPTAVAEFLIRQAVAFAEQLQYAATVLGKIPSTLERRSMLLHRKASDLSEKVRRYLQSSQLQLQSLSGALDKSGTARMVVERNVLSDAAKSLSYANTFVYDSIAVLGSLKLQLMRNSLRFMAAEQVALKTLQQNVKILDPQEVLKRGYSMTMQNGKVLRSIQAVQTGDVIETILPNGSLSSIVQTVKSNENE